MRKIIIIGSCLLIGVIVSLFLPKKVHAACDASMCNTPLDVRTIYHITGLPEGVDPCEYYSGKPPDTFHTVCCESYIRDPETAWGFSWSKWCTPPGVVRPPCECDKTCPDGYEKITTSYGPSGECLACECIPEAPPVPPAAPTAGCDQCGWCDKNGNGILDDNDPKPDYWKKCDKCIRGDDPATDGQPGAWTALGCISTEPSSFISWLLQKIIGIAGGIAFLLILYGGFQILTSTGDPEKLTSGKDIVVSAIAGLLMIIFSVLLLRIIGVDILKIPGFG